MAEAQLEDLLGRDHPVAARDRRGQAVQHRGFSGLRSSGHDHVLAGQNGGLEEARGAGRQRAEADQVRKAGGLQHELADVHRSEVAADALEHDVQPVTGGEHGIDEGLAEIDAAAAGLQHPLDQLLHLRPRQDHVGQLVTAPAGDEDAARLVDPHLLDLGVVQEALQLAEASDARDELVDHSVGVGHRCDDPGQAALVVGADHLLGETAYDDGVGLRVHALAAHQDTQLLVQVTDEVPETPRHVHRHATCLPLSIEPRNPRHPACGQLRHTRPRSALGPQMPGRHVRFIHFAVGGVRPSYSRYVIVIRRLLPLLLLVLVAGLLTPQARAASPARTATVSAVSADDGPLAGPWGRYLTKTDEPYKAWLGATGTNKTLLAKIALRARVRWFGTWIPVADVPGKIQHYVQVSQAGDPDKLVQLAVFRLWPNGGEPARDKPLSTADQAAYRAWIRAAAQGIGSSRVAVVLEPDLPVALKGWRPDVREALTRYAAQVLSALPRTTVYVDAGDADWLTVDDAVKMLRAAGVAYARGFSLGATHYWSASANMTYGRSIVAKLTAAGVPDKHFVIDTADNGKPFTWSQYWAKHPNGDFDNAETCRTTSETRCDTLGHPPTWRTSDPAHVDGYLWFGRPWLYRQNSPFTLSRALAVARTTPY